jgi:hypothetical protein
MSAAGDMSREFAQRHAGTLYDQLARDTEKILEEARTDFGRRDYPWPPETPQRPVCQAVRVKLGGPAARCGCGLVQLCLLSCEHEHMTTEWLCSCCSRAENKT